jgi:hypothetical protein
MAPCLILRLIASLLNAVDALGVGGEEPLRLCCRKVGHHLLKGFDERSIGRIKSVNRKIAAERAAVDAKDFDDLEDERSHRLERPAALSESEA